MIEMSRKCFLKKIDSNKASFLKEKKLSIEISLGDAISDLLKSKGTIPSPDSKNFRAGVYSDSESSYQNLMRHGCELKAPDSHRFVNHNWRF